MRKCFQASQSSVLGLGLPSRCLMPWEMRQARVDITDVLQAYLGRPVVRQYDAAAWGLYQERM